MAPAAPTLLPSPPPITDRIALAEARERLGEAPLRLLFEQAVRPLATTATRGAWYRHWRLMILDGTCLDVPDSPANQVLGRSKSGRGEVWAHLLVHYALRAVM